MALNFEFLDTFTVFNEISNIYKIDKNNYHNFYKNMSQELINDLLVLTNDIFINIKDTEIERQFFWYIDGVNKVNGMICDIQFYFNNTTIDYKKNEKISKIGVILNLRCNDYITNENDLLQHVYFLDFDYKNIDILKNHIFNTLFHAHLITKYYKYSPLFYYCYTEEDLKKMIEIRKRNIRLFGEVRECSVCLEQTISQTKCNHNLCQKCYYNLVEKKCPLCRNYLIDDEDDDYNEIYINNL